MDPDARAVDFFEWLDTLPDEEVDAIWQRLHELCDELGVVVHKKPMVTHQFLDAIPSVAAHLFLN